MSYAETEKWSCIMPEHCVNTAYIQDKSADFLEDVKRDRPEDPLPTAPAESKRKRAPKKPLPATKPNGRPEWRREPAQHHSLRVSKADTVRSQFEKAAAGALMALNPPFATKTFIRFLGLLHRNMNAGGVVFKESSVREVSRLIGIRTDDATGLFRLAEDLGIIERIAVRGRRSIVRASARVRDLQPGQYGQESWLPIAAERRVSKAAKRVEVYRNKRGHPEPVRCTATCGTVGVPQHAGRYSTAYAADGYQPDGQTRKDREAAKKVG
jgi:hypothetical protein